MSDTTHARPVDVHGKPYNRTIMVIVILVATFSGVLMQTSLGTAIPTLMHAFDINLATAQQATTWFLLANGVMIPVSAYLTSRVPTKWLYLAAFSLLWAGMAITAFTPEQHDMWWLFLAGRVSAALGVGISMPLMQVVLVNIFPPEQRGVAMGLGGLVVGMAPAIGPTLSGWILDQNHVIFGLTLTDSWRSIFYVPMIVLGIDLIFSLFFLRDVLPTSKVKLDIISFIYSVIGFGSFLLGFTNVGTDGWGDVKTVITPIVIGVIFITIFIMRQLHMDEPFLNVTVFKNKQFTVTTIAVMLAMMAMMGVEMMLPTYMQNVHNLSALRSGLTLLPGALMMGIMSPIAGMAYDKVGARRLALVGFSLLAIGTVPFMFLTPETPTHYITALYTARMFGVAIVMMPLTASAMSALPPEEANHATASNNTARQLASAVVVALLTSVIQNIINTNKPGAALRDANPLKYGEKMLNASMDGFQVSFLIGFLFAVAGLIVALFLRKGKIIAESNNSNETKEG
ncbi:EmrB/QacA subfamily drug resistance transporter [Weissella uvarum]|uniref:MDR family MFS transporter n=1 Tax=Weissella uvarum TaxID=1479233 RepID=UPI001961EDEC|nr:MDR family MFS transporter [Weissella uvarum]MBM7617123.1 EmrB/QacA subfamily drug resistance transporter [Weissella uvarum]MCM0595419.1 multidrug efflux MFS transporter [Weissella uvarum]